MLVTSAERLPCLGEPLNDQTEFTVFSDTAGNLYLLPQSLLESARVSPDQRDWVLSRCADSGADVQGYNFGFTTGLSFAGSLAAPSAVATLPGFVSTLQNIMQSISTTKETVVGNLK
jgi:hypothetical protein